MKLQKLFDECRIIGLAGAKDSGKTNNQMALLQDFRLTNKHTPIYVYGLKEETLGWARKLGNVFELSSLEQCSDKKNALLCIDEFQRLNLNDRRYRELLNSFVDFIYHNNNWVIFSSPNLREFNSIIGSKIERWVLKSLKMDTLINGSQLKKAVMSYRGRYKVINDIVIPKDKLLIINDMGELVIDVPYIKEADSKLGLKSIFRLPEKLSEKNVREKSEEPVTPKK